MVSNANALDIIITMDMEEDMVTDMVMVMVMEEIRNPK